MIDSADLSAERAAAVAALSGALARRDEALAGATLALRDVASSSVTAARAHLERTRAEEALKVNAARALLYSSNLAMVPLDPSTNDTPPVVSGTYACTTEGIYTITVYPSRAQSGYSYKVSGIESGTFEAFDNSPGALGTCGLYLQFEEDEIYHAQEWQLHIPNIRGTSYQTNYNALILAEERARVAIAESEDALRNAILNAAKDIEPARSEELRKVAGSVDEAFAQIARIDALLERRNIRAPFDGTITEVNGVVGEIATQSEDVVSLLASHAFDVRARIPEVDITKITVGASTSLVFDAKDTETLPGSLVFISPLATALDGVAYFDAIISLNEVPPWMREGLNSDVRIVTDIHQHALRLPRRFIAEEQGVYTIYTATSGNVTPQVLEGVTYGTDGFAVVNLKEGTEVVLPPSPTP
jgi:multidrug efflux pump subunit AcrA (membrane-fusion protein)